MVGTLLNPACTAPCVACSAPVCVEELYDLWESKESLTVSMLQPYSVSGFNIAPEFAGTYVLEPCDSGEGVPVFLYYTLELISGSNYRYVWIRVRLSNITFGFYQPFSLAIQIGRSFGNGLDSTCNQTSPAFNDLMYFGFINCLVNSDGRLNRDFSTNFEAFFEYVIEGRRYVANTLPGPHFFQQ